MIGFTGGLAGSLDRDAESVLLPADVVGVGVEAPDPDDAVEVADVAVVEDQVPRRGIEAAGSKSRTSAWLTMIDRTTRLPVAGMPCRYTSRQRLPPRLVSRLTGWRGPTGPPVSNLRRSLHAWCGDVRTWVTCGSRTSQTRRSSSRPTRSSGCPRPVSAAQTCGPTAELTPSTVPPHGSRVRRASSSRSAPRSPRSGPASS